MASYHLSVKTIKRSAGRSATAAAAYRSVEQIACEREGRVHDYTRKSGVEETFMVAPKKAPDWASFWNAVEASETRKNSVTARKWEVALPAEISAEERSAIARGHDLRPDSPPAVRRIRGLIFGATRRAFPAPSLP